MTHSAVPARLGRPPKEGGPKPAAPRKTDGRSSPERTKHVVYFNEKIGQRLEAALRSVCGSGLGWQAEAARRLGVTARAVYNWRCGNAYPNIDHWIAISRLTKRSLDWLLTGQGPETAPHQAQQRTRF